MLNDARRGKFHVSLIWKLDRQGRPLTHFVRLLEDFKSWGVELVSFSEGLDFGTTTGKLLYQAISAFAEFERDCIHERVRGGMRNARVKGKRLGRPPLKSLSVEDRKAIAKAYWQNKQEVQSAGGRAHRRTNQDGNWFSLSFGKATHDGSEGAQPDRGRPANDHYRRWRNPRRPLRVHRDDSERHPRGARAYPTRAFR
jgi:DNA invertase Pin-like site-specific DNA recombinase